MSSFRPQSRNPLQLSRWIPGLARDDKVFTVLPYPLTLSISAVLGSLLPLAFAPFSFWPIAIFVPALLFALVDKKMTFKRLFLHGWLFGNGYFGFGIYWTYNSLHDFGNAPPVVAAFISALLVVYLAIYPALILCAWQWCKQQIGDRAIWLLPLFWFALEWLKGWFLTGMPWLSLGYAFTDSPLSGFAPLIGVYGISALSILISVALIKIFKHKQYTAIIFVFLVPAAGYALQNIEWTEAEGKPLNIAMVQGNIPQEIKWRFEERQNIFNTYWRETSKLWSNDLIVWPETALPGRSERIEKSILTPLREKVVEQGSELLTGVIVSDSANNLFYNSMVLLGENRSAYHKRHLVVFGEYYPMRWLLDFLRGWINIPYSDLTPGPDEQALMSVKGVKLGLSICFENVFSRSILIDIPEANILVNASNDAWFGDSLAPHQHLQMAQMRANETGRAMVRSTNTGISAFIDARGKIVQRSAQFETLSLSQTVQGRSGTTPFYYFAKVQGVIAILTVLTLLILVFRKRGQKPATSL